MAWRHIGYIRVMYLAGLKAVDPALREAASIDGCNEGQAFRNVVLPALKPINVVVVVITVIEALRAYDIIAALNDLGTLSFGGLAGDYVYGAPEDRQPATESTVFKVNPEGPNGVEAVATGYQAAFAGDFEFG